ncbi:hypothetical protein HaLaN_00832 [Haematococcus lacustris]|uniref:Uncharacterized protein n=1 Tax=Haematococcus lacustris TaxID=44745 RepID=A0A699YGT7_HAELA|nr:hypothetical protein HaLaN_00832 [Haematococcus lacustris]
MERWPAAAWPLVPCCVTRWGERQVQTEPCMQQQTGRMRWGEKWLSSVMESISHKDSYSVVCDMPTDDWKRQTPWLRARIYTEPPLSVTGCVLRWQLDAQGLPCSCAPYTGRSWVASRARVVWEEQRKVTRAGRVGGASLSEVVGAGRAPGGSSSPDVRRLPRWNMVLRRPCGLDWGPLCGSLFVTSMDACLMRFAGEGQGQG